MQSPIFEELRSLVVKTVGLNETIRKMLEPYSDKIKAAFVYGSVARDTDTARSDIDLMVIGDELTIRSSTQRCKMLKLCYGAK